MRKLIWIPFAFGIIGILLGCGSKNYSIFDKKEGPGQVTYYVRVEPGISQSETEAIAKDLESQANGKSTETYIYDGERKTENIIYYCYGLSCTAVSGQ